MDNKMQLFQQRLCAAAKISTFSNNTLVFGEGNCQGKIILIGEAPGKEEEKAGRPFVGKAGQNLNEFLSILNLERENIYITNTVKLRPAKVSPKTGNLINRSPNKQELAFFVPWLLEELSLFSSPLVVTLGNVPLHAAKMDSSAQIGDCHGKPQPCSHWTLFPLYHPAAIIYNPDLKKVYLEDLYLLKNLIENQNK